MSVYTKSIAFWCQLAHILRSTQPAFNLGPLSARQRNAIWMAFRWRANSGAIPRA